MFGMVESDPLEPAEPDSLDSAARKFQKELNAGLIALVLLSVLDRAEGDLYGYQIAKQLQSAAPDLHVVKQGALYPVLRNMSASGLLARMASICLISIRSSCARTLLMPATRPTTKASVGSMIEDFTGLRIMRRLDLFRPAHFELRGRTIRRRRRARATMSALPKR